MNITVKLLETADWLTESIETYMANHVRPHSVPSAFWASDAHKCPRAIYMKMTGTPPQPVPSWVSRLGDGGTDRHKRYQAHFASAGLLVTSEKRFNCTNPLLRGKCDAIIHSPGQKKDLWAVEIKTYNSNALKHLSKPNLDAYTQIQLAMLLLSDIEKGVILYEGRDTAEIKTFYVAKDTAYAKMILAKLSIIQRAINEKQMPDKPVNSKGAKYCEYCEYKHICWE